MFDDTPSQSQFTGSGLERSGGDTVSYHYLGGHGVQTEGIHQMTESGSGNSYTLFEYQNPGPSNHPWTVYGQDPAGGGYWYNDAPGKPGDGTNHRRYGWMALSCSG